MSIINRIFGNDVVSKVEKKEKIEGQIEVLKKEQTVKFENKVKEYETRKTNTGNSIEAQINNLQAQIRSLRANKDSQIELIQKELTVELDKIVNKYSQKITKKENAKNRLANLIVAENKNLTEVITKNTTSENK